MKLCIIQYGARHKELARSSVFSLHYKQMKTPVERKENDLHWVLTGEEDIKLHLCKRDDGGIALSIVKPGEPTSKVPEFAQLNSGGKADVFRVALEALVQILKNDADMVGHAEVVCYSYLDELYDVIADEHLFQKASG